MSLIERLKNQFINSKKKQKETLDKEKEKEKEFRNKFESIVKDSKFLNDLDELMRFFDSENKNSQGAEKCGYKIEEYSKGPQLKFYKDGRSNSIAFIELCEDGRIRVGDFNINNPNSNETFSIHDKEGAQEHFLELVTENMSLRDND